jgi:hypothetical protein
MKYRYELRIDFGNHGYNKFYYFKHGALQEARTVLKVHKKVTLELIKL